MRIELGPGPVGQPLDQLHHQAAGEGRREQEKCFAVAASEQQRCGGRSKRQEEQTAPEMGESNDSAGNRRRAAAPLDGSGDHLGLERLFWAARQPKKQQQRYGGDQRESKRHCR